MINSLQISQLSDLYFIRIKDRLNKISTGVKREMSITSSLYKFWGTFKEIYVMNSCKLILIYWKLKITLFFILICLKWSFGQGKWLLVPLHDRVDLFSDFTRERKRSCPAMLNRTSFLYICFSFVVKKHIHFKMRFSHHGI